jgi:hypothetical protein
VIFILRQLLSTRVTIIGNPVTRIIGTEGAKKDLFNNISVPHSAMYNSHVCCLLFFGVTWLHATMVLHAVSSSASVHTPGGACGAQVDELTKHLLSLDGLTAGDGARTDSSRATLSAYVLKADMRAFVGPYRQRIQACEEGTSATDSAGRWRTAAECIVDMP